MTAEGLADRVPDQRLDLRVIRRDDVPLDGEVLVLVGPHGAARHVARVDDAALGRARPVLAGPVPDAADDEDGVALAHLARRAQRAVRRPADGRLGPLVRTDDDLRRAVVEVGVLDGTGRCCQTKSGIFGISRLGIGDSPLRRRAGRAENSRRYLRGAQSAVPCHRGVAAARSRESLG